MQSSENRSTLLRWVLHSMRWRARVKCKTLARKLLSVEIHNSGAGSKSHSKTHHYRRSRPSILFSQHETCRSAREIAVAFQHLIGTVHFGGVWLQVELRTNAVENLLAAGVDQAIVNLGHIRDWRIR